MDYLIFSIKDFFKQLLRTVKFFFQRFFRGWDDSETWDFQYEFLKWILPRLKRVRKISIAYPIGFTPESWEKFQDELIKQVEKCLEQFDKLGEMTLEEEEEFFKEVNKLIQILCDNLKHFGW